ncbi:MAG TPA: extracellular solute-binding protein [Gaiellaceae bacterium]|nr:extracellular solute-binding protein [Gaiellaceae bacterium]
MRRRFVYLALLAVLALMAAACGGGSESSGTGTSAGGDESVSGSVSLMGIWVGTEQQSIQAVLDGFKEKFPNVDVKYNAAGDNIVTVLATAVQGGNPPDLATIAQPGTIAEYAKDGDLKPIDFAKSTVQENFGDSIVALGTVDGQLYSFLFKGANKSTVWYNVPVFNDAGVDPPDTWDQFLENAQTLKASGVPAYSIGGADGWTLTDLFENIYIRTAGPEMYDKLATHDIPWTDQSVKDALTEMGKILGDTDNIAGGKQGALQTDFPTSVTQVFADPPKAAQVIEADFVAGEIVNSTKAKPETGFNEFDFPSINGSPPAVVGGGDQVVMFKDTPASRALVEYLASPEAAAIWVKRGGFSSPNLNVDEGDYPDPILRATATALASAEVFRFDLSDLQPSAFGGTVGQGLFKLFQDFLANPSDVNGIAQQMEDAAQKAYNQ